MIPYETYLARLKDGSIAMAFYSDDIGHWCYLDSGMPVWSGVVKAFLLTDAMTFLEDAEWEGKIKSAPLEEE